MKNPLEIVKARFPANKIKFNWKDENLQSVDVDGKNVKVNNVLLGIPSLLEYHDISVDEEIVAMLTMLINNTLR